MNQNSEQSHQDRRAEAPLPERAQGSGASGTFDKAQRAEACESALAEMSDRWMRSEAEVANIRNRAKRDVEDARQFAVQKFATDVVEAAENLQRGLQRLPPASAEEPESITGIRAGLIEIERGFVGLLERNGVKRDDPNGSSFDPNLHQAMAEQEAAGIKPGTILQTMSPTWTLNGRLLRPAMVVVSKAAPTAAASPTRRHSTAP